MSHPSALGRRRATLAAGTVAALAVAGLAGRHVVRRRHGAPSDHTPPFRPPSSTHALLRRPDPLAAAAHRSLRTAQRRPPAAACSRPRPTTPSSDIAGSTGTVRVARRPRRLPDRPQQPRSAGGPRLRRGPPRRPGADSRRPRRRSTWPATTATSPASTTSTSTSGSTGSTVIGTGLTAAVNRHGRLLMVGGSPKANTGWPPRAGRGGARDARRRSRGGAGRCRRREPTPARTPSPAGLFVTPRGRAPAWQAS